MSFFAGAPPVAKTATNANNEHGRRKERVFCFSSLGRSLWLACPRINFASYSAGFYVIARFSVGSAQPRCNRTIGREYTLGRIILDDIIDGGFIFRENAPRLFLIFCASSPLLGRVDTTRGVSFSLSLYRGEIHLKFRTKNNISPRSPPPDLIP